MKKIVKFEFSIYGVDGPALGKS